MQQGCQMVYFQTQNPYLGIMFESLRLVKYILCSFGTFCTVFASCTKKSGNPAMQ
jgi:hypothetical protein